MYYCQKCLNCWLCFSSAYILVEKKASFYFEIIPLGLWQGAPDPLVAPWRHSEAEWQETPWAFHANYPPPASSGLQLPGEIWSQLCKRYRAERWSAERRNTALPAGRKRFVGRAVLLPERTREPRRWPIPGTAGPAPSPQYGLQCSAFSQHSASPLWLQYEPQSQCQPTQPGSLKPGEREKRSQIFIHLQVKLLGKNCFPFWSKSVFLYSCWTEYLRSPGSCMVCHFQSELKHRSPASAQQWELHDQKTGMDCQQQSLWWLTWNHNQSQPERIPGMTKRKAF